MEVNLAPGYDAYDMNNTSDNARYHEAGFDSYLTGWVFAKLTNSKPKEILKQCENKLSVFICSYCMVLN